MFRRHLWLLALVAAAGAWACSDDPTAPDGGGLEPNPCSLRATPCEPPLVCDGATGECVDRCAGKTCPAPQACNSATGGCACPCELPGEHACGTGLRCETRGCTCVPAAGIGAPCEKGSDCGGSNSACLRPGDYGVDWVDGYCTAACNSSTTPCPGNSTCTSLGCLASCEVDGDCGREDYRCLGGICYPMPLSVCRENITGQDCDDDADCPYGRCDGGRCACVPFAGACFDSADCIRDSVCSGTRRERQPGCDWDEEDAPACDAEHPCDVGTCFNGRCSCADVLLPGRCITVGTCERQSPWSGCPAGARCVNYDGDSRIGACVPQSRCDWTQETAPACATDDDCSAGVCEGGKCTCSPVGGRCDRDDDCLEGGGCITGWQGGMCTVWDCRSRPCPDGSSCVQLGSEPDPYTPGLGFGLYACLADCAQQTAAPGGEGLPNCRLGYTCSPSTFDLCDPTLDPSVDQCGPGRVCAAGACVEKSCTRASEATDCGEGEYCYFASNLGGRGLCLKPCDGTDAACRPETGGSCTLYSVDNPTCRYDDDCEAGGKCRRQTLSIACHERRSCPQGFSCEDGICTSVTGLCVPECAEDADCRGNNDDRHNVCHNGVCYRGLCTPGARFEGICVPGCGSDAGCFTCTNNFQCGTGNYCDVATGRCEDGCARPLDPELVDLGYTSWCDAGEECNEAIGRCQQRCGGHGDCGLGGVCEAGWCQPVAQLCNLSNGACQPVCVDDGQCGVGNRCDLATGACYQTCTDASECIYGVCDTETGRCTVPCETFGCPLGDVCEGYDHACHARCTVTPDRCPEDRICVARSGRCELRCDRGGSCGPNEVCASDGACILRCGPLNPCAEGVCDETSGFCVGCVSDEDCTPPATCDRDTRTCVTPA